MSKKKKEEIKEIDLNPLNEMAGGNCRSMGEMFKKIGKKKGKEVIIGGVKTIEMSLEDSKKILGILHPEEVK